MDSSFVHARYTGETHPYDFVRGKIQTLELTPGQLALELPGIGILPAIRYVVLQLGRVDPVFGDRIAQIFVNIYGCTILLLRMVSWI